VLQVVKENIFPLLTIIFIIILRSHPNVRIFIESLKKGEFVFRQSMLQFIRDGPKKKTKAILSLEVRLKTPFRDYLTLPFFIPITVQHFFRTLRTMLTENLECGPL
jgi:hypothetical protein